MLTWKLHTHRGRPFMTAELDTGLKIVVHRHDPNSEKFAVTCDPPIVVNKPLEFTDLEEACTEAAIVVREWLDETTQAMTATGSDTISARLEPPQKAGSPWMLITSKGEVAVNIY